jgi:hypothetical protein
MLRVLGFLMLLPLLAGCGGWHPLYQDPANPSGTATYTATIANGTVTPPSGTITQGTLVTFVATPSSGFECVTYTVNGGSPVNCAPANPSANGGDPVTVAIPISQASISIVFQTTTASGTTGNPGTTVSFTAAIDQGTVTPTTGTATFGAGVNFTATPPAGFEVSTYTVNSGTPVNCGPANPSSAGGDAVSVNIPISSNPSTIQFQTVAISTTNRVHLPFANN